MFTSVDKAIAAGIMAIVYLVNNFFGFHFGIDESTVNGLAGVIGTVLVWLVPNKPPSA